VNMANVVRGKRDKNVRAILAGLHAYETRFPGSVASLYRRNPGAVVVRIVDERFARLPRSRRHDRVWQFLADRLGEDTMGEISALLLLAPAEKRTSLANQEFEDPVASHL